MAETSRPAAIEIDDDIRRFGKKPSFLANLNYAFALRMTLASALAWWLAARFQLDKNYWALMTVSIVSYPDKGALVAKFAARTAGTFVGIITVNILAKLGLSEPWLFSCYLALWLAFCAYMATCYGGMTSYGFALCGYTSAILGFPLSLAPWSITVFDLSQGRLSEIMLGLICAWLVSFIFTFREEERPLKEKLEKSDLALYRFIGQIADVRANSEEIARQYKSAVDTLITAKTNAYYARLNLTANDDENRVYYRYLYAQMEIYSKALALEAMKAELLNKAGPNGGRPLRAYLEALKAWLSAPDSGRPRPDAAGYNLGSAPETAHFIRQFNHVIDAVALLGRIPRRKVYVMPPDTPFRDLAEAGLNAARTFICIMAGVALWLASDWTMGYFMVILVAIACTLGATFPQINRLITVMFILAMLVVPFTYALIFGLLIQANSLVPAMMIILPVFFIAFLCKTLSRLSFVFWHCFLISFIVLTNFANPISFDYSRFTNVSMAVIVSLLIGFVFFSIIIPTPDNRKIKRFKRLIAGRFQTTVRNLTPAAAQQFKAYVYNSINVSATAIGNGPSPEFTTYVHLHMAAMRVIDFMPPDATKYFLESSSFVSALNAEKFDDCLKQLTVAAGLTKDPEVRGHLWELGCLINFLRPSAPAALKAAQPA